MQLCKIPFSKVLKYFTFILTQQGQLMLRFTVHTLDIRRSQCSQAKTKGSLSFPSILKTYGKKTSITFIKTHHYHSYRYRLYKSDPQRPSPLFSFSNKLFFGFSSPFSFVHSFFFHRQQQWHQASLASIMCTETNAACCHFEHASSDPLPLKIESYESAVKDLGGLQSNYATVQMVRATGGLLNQHSIPELEAFMEKIGYNVDDLDKLNIIHVTGTKGKGSTCAFVNSILQQVDSPNKKLKIGLFTSPHLIEVRERIQIDGKPISEELFAKYFYETYNRLRSKSPPLRKVSPTSPYMPMYFRFLNLMAVHVFLSEGIDVAIMEVGVGGQYDSTNAVRKPVVCGIASLGLDHQSTLGSTIESIAWHKAGIIKDNIPAITVPQENTAMDVIRSRAAERNAPLSVAEPLTTDKYKLGIPGDHQRINAALAEALCRKWIDTKMPEVDVAKIDEWVAEGIRQASWPGRSQTFVSPRHQNLTWHVDGAHTVESIAACAKWFAAEKEQFTGQCVLLFNAAHERSFDVLLQTLNKHSGECEFVEAVFCPNISDRADSVNFTVDRDEKLGQQHGSAKKWAELSGNETTKVLPTINAAVEYIESKYGSASTNSETHVLATGSLHLVGGALDIAKGSI